MLLVNVVFTCFLAKDNSVAHSLLCGSLAALGDLTGPAVDLSAPSVVLWVAELEKSLRVMWSCFRDNLAKDLNGQRGCQCVEL